MLFIECPKFWSIVCINPVGIFSPSQKGNFFLNLLFFVLSRLSKGIIARSLQQLGENLSVLINTYIGPPSYCSNSCRTRGMPMTSGPIRCLWRLNRAESSPTNSIGHYFFWFCSYLNYVWILVTHPDNVYQSEMNVMIVVWKIRMEKEAKDTLLSIKNCPRSWELRFVNVMFERKKKREDWKYKAVWHSVCDIRHILHEMLYQRATH